MIVIFSAFKFSFQILSLLFIYLIIAGPLKDPTNDPPISVRQRSTNHNPKTNFPFYVFHLHVVSGLEEQSSCFA